MKKWLLLAGAIVSEVTASLALQAAQDHPAWYVVVGVGFVAAFIVAFFTVRAVLAVIGRIGFTPFGWYRIGLGLVMMAVLALT